MTQTFCFQSYDEDELTNDIALLKLSSDVTYDDYVRQVCLPQSADDEYFDSVVCYTSGWGATSECRT